ncbi:MAG: hypothetical protein QF363_15200 [Planctomycetaceae bacterium]|jgi:hypothetical protein|nr:hypothetical protein [Planctomycetaceae bacterium]
MDSEPNTDSPTSQPQAAEQSSPTRSPEWQQWTGPIVAWLKVFFSKEDPQYQVRVLGSLVVGLLLATWLGWAVREASLSQNQQEAWSSWIEAEGEIAAGEDPATAYRAVVDSGGNEVVRSWAKLKEAEAQLSRGLVAAYKKGDEPGIEKSDRFGRNNEIEEAKEAFEKLAGSSDRLLQERALYGVAVSSEVLCDGTKDSIDQVIAAYSALGKSSDFYRSLAEQRKTELGNGDEARSFYRWFSVIEARPEEPKVEPPPAAGTGTTSGAIHPLITPGADTAKTSADGQGKTNKKRAIPDEKKPAAKKPAAKKPAAKKPAAKKPAAKKPAAKKPAAKKKLD